MNAVPDLLIIYEINGKSYAKMLECKYSLDEGYYEDVVGIKCKMQFFIQECIMEFCFGLHERDISVPPFPGKKRNFWNSEGIEKQEGAFVSIDEELMVVYNLL